MTQAYAPGDVVTIHYRRPPDRLQVFEQAVVEDDGDCVVTFLPSAQLKKPVEAGGRVVLEPGAPVVWFTYRGDVWHDVGRFHLADGTFTGIYANVLTPVVMRGAEWETTDLFLDVWVGADGEVEILDRDEFDDALAAGWIDASTAARALAEAERLAADARAGIWPPAEVREWTVERARDRDRTPTARVVVRRNARAGGLISGESHVARIGRERGETAPSGASPDPQAAPPGRHRVEREPPGRQWKTMLFLLVLCGLVYNTNGQTMASGDTLPARLIPFSILLDGTTALDPFFAADVGGAAGLRQAGRDERMRYYFLTSRNDRLYSTYPITTPALVTPLYAPVVWLKGEWTTEEIERIAPIGEKLASSLIAALGVAGMFLLLAALTKHRYAVLLALVFGFATTTWTTSSQALWQHGPSVLFIILTLALLAHRPNATWLAGLSAGLAVDARLSVLFFLLAVIGVVGWYRRSLRSAAQVALGAAAAGLPLALYNGVVFGDLRGGYARVDDAFAGSLAEGLAGVLISPSRGLLVYSPVLLAGFVGLYLVCRRGSAHHSPVYVVSAVFLATQLVFFGWWDAWWGGWSYGPRLLTEAAAVLVVLAVPAVERLHVSRLARSAFVILLLYSASVQAIGALAYTGGWDATPVSVDRDPDRLWDWQDSQIRRTASSFVRGEWLAGCRTVVQWLTSRCSRGLDDAPAPEGTAPILLVGESIPA